ncbi:MAG: microcystin-dependent protein [Myxococcota bacterium]|jgi:microcystin-dependent protein
MDPFIGQIIMFGGNFEPRGWAFCEGQLLSINSYSALFSILGVTYGGDGVSTFALPDLRGRVPVQRGDGPGLSDYRLGQRGGAESETLTTNQLPSHSHRLQASNAPAGQLSPEDNLLAGQSPSSGLSTYTNSTPDTQMSSSAISSAGGSQPVDIRQPYCALNFIIALQGVYPSRS